jgi:hypothetical protein
LAHSDATIINNVIAGNMVDDDSFEVDADMEQDGQGGGIDIQLGGPAGPLISGNLIVDNVASAIGGGVVIYEENGDYIDGTLINNTIVFNSVLDTDWGAGVAQFRRTEPTMDNNIVAFNHGSGAWSEDDVDALYTYSLTYGNDPDFAGLMTGSGTGDVSADPLFVRVSDDSDWTNDDYQLQSRSPARHVGNPAFNNPDGTRSDMGAYGGVYGGW